MMYENEIVTLLLGTGTLYVIVDHWGEIKRIPAYKRLMTGFFLLFLGWIATILEGFLWPEFLNILEHSCYALSAIFVLLWCWKVFARGNTV